MASRTTRANVGVRMLSCTSIRPDASFLLFYMQSPSTTRWMAPSTPRRSAYSRTPRGTASTAQSPMGFYGRPVEHDDEWQPGEVIIPHAPQNDAIDELKRVDDL